MDAALQERLIAELRERGWVTRRLDVPMRDTIDGDPCWSTAGYLERDAHRLLVALDRLRATPDAGASPIGIVASGDASAIVLRALAARPDAAAALVSFAGRLDLVPPARLARVRVPALLVAGAYDAPLLDFNRLARYALRAAELRVVPRTRRRFDDPATRTRTVDFVRDWIGRHARRAESGGADARSARSPASPRPSAPPTSPRRRDGASAA